MPSSTTGTVSPSSLAQVQRTGREKRRSGPQRIDFQNWRPRTTSASRSGSTSTSSRPGTVTPRTPSRSSSRVGDRRRAAARTRRPPARGGRPGGPCTHWSAVRAGRSSTRTTSRRGPTQTSAGAAPRVFSTSPGSCASASRHARAGSSSQPISKSRLGSCGLPLGRDVGLGDRPGEVPHPPDVGRALGHRDRPARVEQVERVRALEHLVVGGDRQPALDERPGLAPRSRRSGASARSTSATSKL